MPFIQKIKSKGGKSTLKTKRNILTGKEMLISKDVEYATENSPRKVFKNVEVMDKEGVTSYMKMKVRGKTVKKEKSFTPKSKINIGPSS
jgi:hypothetical protein